MKWVKTSDRQPSDGIDVRCYHPDFVDKDFNPEGLTFGFVSGGREALIWTVAIWDGMQDCWNVSHQTPELWLSEEFPKLPTEE